MAIVSNETRLMILLFKERATQRKFNIGNEKVVEGLEAAEEILTDTCIELERGY